MSNLDVCEELSQNMIDYAYAVNSDRAIPSAADGLKPVARRILYSMSEKKQFSNKAHVKCASIVGNVMGDYHPHGDSSIYGALVHLAQNWIMRYPLIDFHGNMGNVGGDGPAAYRYTEGRLSTLPEKGMLANLEKGNVETQPNYSEVKTEPVLLPAIFPNLLCNPNSGIGVAIATEFLPHNLCDIANIITNYIVNNELNYSNLYPDFPLGGTIINKDEVHKIYETGKGKVVVEATVEIDDNKIIFTDLPFQVNTESLLDQINKAYEEDKITNISEVRNESGRGQIRIVVELTNAANAEKVLTQLYSETDLRKSYNANQVALVGKTPKLLTLKEIIDIYIQHNVDCIKREYEYDLHKASQRAHILEGLLVAFNHLDDIIDIIRYKDNAKSWIMDVYGLDEEQTQAILDMKLSKLSHLEEEKLQNELEEKKKIIEHCYYVLTNYSAQTDILCDRLNQLVKEYGDERRTKVIQKEIKKTAAKAKTAKEVLPETVVVTINRDGYIKSIPVANYRSRKTDDILAARTDTTDMVILYSDAGKVYRLAVKNIKQCGTSDKGTALGAILQMDNQEHIIQADLTNNGSINNYVLFATDNGMVKKTDLYEYRGSTQNLRGSKCMNIKDGDALLCVLFGNDDEYISLRSKNYRITFPAIDLNYQGKTAGGVKGINLDSDDVICDCSIGKTPATTPQKRGGRGRKVAN